MYTSLRSFTLASILAVTGIASASPLAERDIQVPDLWNLETRVVAGNDSGTDKNGLWLYSSHTGAGLGDAALSPNKTHAWEGYLNGTRALFTYPGANMPSGWPLDVSYGTLYQAWNPVTLSISGPVSPNETFFFNGTGLQFSRYGEISPGWLACDWWHDAVQLFSLTPGIYPQSFPTSCSKVELYPIAV